jgi:hypothetical protein
MSQHRTGKRIAVTPARAVVLELLHHARKASSLPLAKTMNLEAILEPRKTAGVSWTALFLKAYGLTALEHPELRRAFIPYPTKHFYEHPDSIAAILVEREWQGENVVLGGRLRAPEERALVDIDVTLREFRERPVWDVNYFRQTLRLGQLPAFVRRFVFWHSLYLSGAWRAKRFGTFMISSLGNLGVEQFHPLTFLTTYLTYGPIGPTGDVTVKIIYDHRVLDGLTVARALGTLEAMLVGPILAELQAGSARARLSVPD